MPHVECFPKPVLKWTEEFYGAVFGKYGSFSLRDNGEASPLELRTVEWLPSPCYLS